MHMSEIPTRVSHLRTSRPFSPSEPSVGTVAVPREWLARTIKLLHQMSGSGVFLNQMAHYDDLVDELCEFLNLVDEDEPCAALIAKLDSGA